jgi:N-acetylglutamate synthase-like GNAT family acetyltransferase
MQHVRSDQAIIVRRARGSDVQEIETLLCLEDLDRSAFVLEDFFVAETPSGCFAGCARLKSYGDCVELSSVAVHAMYRGQGIGRTIVATLLARATVPEIYLVCEPKEIAFFARFGFQVLCRAGIPRALLPKLFAYEAKVGPMVAMKREA